MYFPKSHRHRLTQIDTQSLLSYLCESVFICGFVSLRLMLDCRGR